MSPLTTDHLIDSLASSAKAAWEDPAVTLERDLEVRAQGGPTGDSPAPSGVMFAPFNQSGLDCSTTSTQ